MLNPELTLIYNRTYSNYDGSCIIGLEFDFDDHISIIKLNELKEKVTDLLEDSDIAFSTDDICIFRQYS